MMHGSEGIVRLVVLRRAVRGRRRDAVAVRARARAPAVRCDRARAARPARLCSPGPAPYSELSSALSLLLLGSVLAQLLSYASFLAANILATPAEKASVGLFITGLFIARIPILLFQAVQAALLPKLAGLAGEGRHDDFRGGMRKLVLIVVGLGHPRHDRGGDDRAVRRRAAVRQGQVHPRSPRPRAARRGQRLLHPGPDARAGPDRAARLRRGRDLLDDRHRRVRRRHGRRQRPVPAGRARLRRRHRGRRRSRWASRSWLRMRRGITADGLEELVENIAHEPLEI